MYFVSYIELKAGGKAVKRLAMQSGKKLTHKQADALVRAYYDEIYIFVYKQTFDKELAMDLTQEIFISVLQAYSTYDAKKASVRTWIYRIASNKIIDYRRSRSAKEQSFLSVEDFTEPIDEGFEYKVEDRELLQRVESFISTYDFTTQQIFRLRIFADLPFSQIAFLTHEQEARVKTVYYRLLKQIRKEFGDAI